MRKRGRGEKKAELHLGTKQTLRESNPRMGQLYARIDLVKVAFMYEGRLSPHLPNIAPTMWDTTSTFPELLNSKSLSRKRPQNNNFLNAHRIDKLQAALHSFQTTLPMSPLLSAHPKLKQFVSSPIFDCATWKWLDSTKQAVLSYTEWKRNRWFATLFKTLVSLLLI